MGLCMFVDLDSLVKITTDRKNLIDRNVCFSRCCNVALFTEYLLQMEVGENIVACNLNGGFQKY